MSDNKKLELSVGEKVKVYGNLQGDQGKVFDGYVIRKSTGEQIIDCIHLTKEWVLRDYFRINRMNNFYLLFLTTLLIFGKISYVEAYEPIDQSFCRPGYHPEGPSFAYDCVSNSTGEIEGQESGSGSSSSSSYPLPPPSNTPRVKGHAENVWGALVWDSQMLIANYKESKNIGIAMGQKTKQEAIDFAMSECENDGGKHCQVQATISGSCLALAGAKGQILWATQKHTEGDNAFDTSAAAEKKALAKCNEKGYQRCEVFYSDCSIIKWVWD